LIIRKYFSEVFVLLDGKASTDSIRQDLGMCLTRNGHYPC
jgi:hypothetical protein